MFIGSILLIGAYFFPLWSITLEAPQYPDGLRLDIWLYTIGGSSEHVLQNINILNHYIGMKKIVPEAIPELKIFPYIVGGLIAFGLLVAVLKRKWFLFAWVIAFGIFGIGAMYDFYLWEYDYGHDLDPMAPIKVPGMVYQPPLFGEKWLLNFKALSYPATGAYFMIASVGCGILAAINTIRGK
jgi:copper chaperone NosL